VSLLEDQTNFLRKLGVSAGSIGVDKALDLKIEKGECSVVFLLLESLLGNGWWGSMLSSDVYKNNLIDIVVDEAHCISHWLAFDLVPFKCLCGTCRTIKYT